MMGPDANDLSLNDFLDTGLNYIPKLFDVLLKVRCHWIALVSDIEKAYLMIGIDEDDREKLRFLCLRAHLKLMLKLSSTVLFWFTTLTCNSWHCNFKLFVKV